MTTMNQSMKKISDAGKGSSDKAGVQNDVENGRVTGEVGHRSPYLSHAKRALYHLSYIPMI